MADVGRPTVVTPKIIEKLEKAFLIGCTDLEACLYAKISKSTLYNYQNEHPEFVERKEALKENPCLISRKTVVRSLTRNPDIALKYLERKKRAEFATRTETTGADGAPLTVNLVNDVPDSGS